MKRDELVGVARNWLKWSAILFALFLFMTTTWAFYAVKFQRTTGEAEWLWTWNWISRGNPAVFFATTNFRLDDTRPYVHLKVASDPMYALFFNEVEVGGGRWSASQSIDVYDVTDLAIDGTNRIVIAVRAPRGVGGLLAAVDTGPLERNIVVTSDEWRIFHEWSPDLLVSDSTYATVPRVLGKPPVGRWDFPPEVEKGRYQAGGYVLHPTEHTSIDAALKEINVIGGVAIAGREEVDASVWDFGEVAGRPRIAVEPGEERVIRYRTVDALSDLDDGGEPSPLVVAAGEETVTEPLSRSFRYFVAFDPVESVELLSDRP